jgi:hypothetical protein
MAIVLVIITILIGGLAMPLSAQIEARRIAETRKTMDEAREALIGFTMSHSCTCAYNSLGTSGTLLAAPQTTCSTTCPLTNPSSVSLTLQHPYLPCPDTDNDGKENRTGSACSTTNGLFPWVDLGTAAQDAWGNRLHYSLTLAYGDTSTGFSNSSPGDNQVCNTSAGGCALGTVASNVPVVLVSYGPNGWGARTVNNTDMAAPTSADELENTNANNAYVSRTPSKSGSASGEFDDLVTWISSPLLISRVCPAGGCP